MALVKQLYKLTDSDRSLSTVAHFKIIENPGILDRIFGFSLEISFEMTYTYFEFKVTSDWSSVTK